jgi:hypothetical protein
VFEEAARLLRQMDGVLGDANLDPHTRLFTAWEFSRRASDLVRPYRPANPWPHVDAVLGPEPLRHNDRINDLLDTWDGGGIPDWAFNWLRKSR